MSGDNYRTVDAAVVSIGWEKNFVVYDDEGGLAECVDIVQLGRRRYDLVQESSEWFLDLFLLFILSSVIL